MQDNPKKLIVHLLRPHYHWQRRLPSADWSTCQLSDRAVCGNGIKTRMLDCVRSDGKSVDLKYCKEVRSRCHYRPIFATIFFYQTHLFIKLGVLQLGLERKWQMNASCTVECPVNCQLSEWSSWSRCTRTCGLAGRFVTFRSRMTQQRHKFVNVMA